MPRILMYKWLPASGKSTAAKRVVEAYPWKVKRVNKDDLRAMLDNSKHTKGNENYVLRMRDMIVRDCLSSGLDIIVDDTNFNPIHELTLRKIADEFDAGFEVVFFDTPLSECIERDEERENSVGRNVIMQMYKQYLYKEIPYNDLLSDCIICDIDWTLANIWPRWRYDESLVWVDTIIPQVRDIINREPWYVFLVSGRHDTCKNETMERLDLNKVRYDGLYMREADDNRPDNVIKQEIFEKFFRNKFNVKYAIDDRLRILSMRFELWVFTMNVNQGNIDF